MRTLFEGAEKKHCYMLNDVFGGCVRRKSLYLQGCATPKEKVSKHNTAKNAFLDLSYFNTNF